MTQPTPNFITPAIREEIEIYRNWYWNNGAHTERGIRFVMSKMREDFFIDGITRSEAIQVNRAIRDSFGSYDTPDCIGSDCFAYGGHTASVGEGFTPTDIPKNWPKWRGAQYCYECNGG
tara:strand:+ start:5718 stop:6074 length:357 start_codon:yes stop_codon:yes gene_type:complete